MSTRPELLRLSKPFPPQFVAKKEGADYVNHAIVQQRLLGTVGPFDMRVDHIIRGPIAEKTTGRGDRQKTWPGADNAVVGVVLTCTFTIDGKPVEVSEVGTPEGYYMAPHDGDRLKKAMSDALKRCAMRVGVGLDLWSKGTYVLPTMLEKGLDTETGEVDPEASAPEPDHDAPDPDDVADDPAPVDVCDVCGAVDDGHSHDPAPAEAEAQTPPDPAGEEQEGFTLDPAESARLRATFFAIIKNELGLDYERDVRPFLQEKYGGSWSEMDDRHKVRIVSKLTPEGSRTEKEKAQQAFGALVREWQPEPVPVTPTT